MLQRGDAAASDAELDAVAGELAAAGLGRPDLADALRRTAVGARLGRPDYGAVMAAFDERLADDLAAAGPEGRMFLQSLSAPLLPLAGLDLEMVRDSARTFLANFPAVSLPFGDVDERAANWLARLHDAPAVRQELRALLGRLAGAWAAAHPLAAEQARRWGAGPAPDDPTTDQPWMLALVALVRAEL